jgi:hypothetical protein
MVPPHATCTDCGANVSLLVVLTNWSKEIEELHSQINMVVSKMQQRFGMPTGDTTKEKGE